jgi:hypothetical protein
MNWVAIRPIDAMGLLSESEMTAYRNSGRASVVVTGDTGLNSPVITNLDSTSTILVGMTASCTKIIPPRTVVSVDSATQVTLDDGAGLGWENDLAITFAEPDKLEAIVANVIAELRGRIEAMLGTDVSGSTNTLPDALKHWALVMARHRLLTVLPIVIGEDRQVEMKRAETFVADVIAGKSGLSSASGGAQSGFEDRVSLWNGE